MKNSDEKLAWIAVIVLVLVVGSCTAHVNHLKYKLDEQGCKK